MTIRIGARLWWGAPILLVLLWAVGLLVVPNIPGIPMPPAFTGWLLPLARFARDAAGAIAIGAVLVGLLTTSTRPRAWALRWVAIWLACVILLLALTVTDLFAVLPDRALRSVPTFLTEGVIGPVFLGPLALLVVLLALVPFSHRWVSWSALGLALIVFMLPSLLGHGGLTGEHISLVISLAIHLAAMALWVGGLAVVVALLVVEPEHAPMLMPRFSLLALWCVICLAESGLLNASLRIGEIGAFVGTLYGSVVLMKIALLAWLIRLGWLQRTRALPAVTQGTPALVVRFAGSEMLVMGGAIALAVLLSRIGPGALTPDLVGFAPLALVSLAFVLPGLLAVWLPWPAALVRLREFPEVPGVLLLVVVALAGMGAVSRILGVQLGAVVGTALLVGCGWLALGALRGPRARLGWLVLAIGCPLVTVFASIVSGRAEWPLVLVSVLLAEVLLWLVVRVSTAQAVVVVDG